MADEGKAFLRQTDKNGVSVYSHLTEVLSTLLEKKPPNALDMLEGVSMACKSKHYDPDTIEISDAPPELMDAPKTELLDATAAMLAASGAPPGEDGPGEATGAVADVMYERGLFECVGVGLSSDESYRVYVSLVQLQKSKDLASVRFFGKVLGVPGDYYVAEGVYNTPPEPEEGYEPPPPPPGAPVEESGVGCNKYVYFAANDPSGTWTALPDVTPQQIVCSKRIRKYLTGSLEADVRAYPPFPGQEKAYLRALIARIVAATTLCPAGKFALAEEPTEEPTEVEIGTDEGQRSAISAAALGESAGWVTRYMGILEIGRCTNPPVEEEEEDPDNPKPPAPEPQKEMPYLSPLVDGEWTTSTFVHGGPAVAVARSVRWPGAYSAYQLVKGGAECMASMYIGYGHDTLDKPFKMEAPPPFQVEPEEVHEQADMPLDEENAAYKTVLEAQVAEEAANLPDPEAEE